MWVVSPVWLRGGYRRRWLDLSSQILDAISKDTTVTGLEEEKDPCTLLQRPQGHESTPVHWSTSVTRYSPSYPIRPSSAIPKRRRRE